MSMKHVCLSIGYLSKFIWQLRTSESLKDSFLFKLIEPVTSCHIPGAVGDGAVGVDTDEGVRDGDVVKVSRLLVGEEEVWCPDGCVVFRVENDDAVVRS